jgi:hypothetical protein
MGAQSFVVMEPYIGRITCLGAAPASPRVKGRNPAKQRRLADMLGGMLTLKRGARGLPRQDLSCRY